MHYAEVDEAGEYGTVHADYRAGVSSVVGRHLLDDHGASVMDDVRARRIVVVDDVADDPRLDGAQRAAARSLGIGAYAMVPLVRQGRVVALLVVHFTAAHRWSEDELAAVAETAERTWAAVEQARAEESLRIRHAQEHEIAVRLQRSLLPDELVGLRDEPVDAVVGRLLTAMTAGSPGGRRRGRLPSLRAPKVTVPADDHSGRQ